MIFGFMRHDDGRPASPFDLGDVVVVGERESVSSAGRSPSQSMMIYLALDDLISGVLKVLDGEVATHEFVGPDSSFTLFIAREVIGDRVKVKYGRQVIAKERPLDLLKALCAGVDEFFSVAENRLPLDAAGAEDLDRVIQGLHSGVPTSG